MKTIIDQHIPHLQGVLEPFGPVVYAPGDAINKEMVRDADVLLVRTRTRCNAELLEASRVQFIGTATIGTDHIDLDYCRRRHITVANAQGCNANAVGQYVARVLVAIEQTLHRPLHRCTLGIVGAGHTGRSVYHYARQLGLRVLVNDPPLARACGTKIFTPIQQLLLASHIISLHVPLDASTYHLANDHFFRRMKYRAAFINTSRGNVVNAVDLLYHRHRLSFVALDVWPHEPHLSPALLTATNIATPHIAGYSLQGKRNATLFLLRALAEHLHLPPDQLLPAPDFPLDDLREPAPTNHNELCAYISKNYPIFDDDKQLRNHPQQFEQLRNQYILRNEW